MDDIERLMAKWQGELAQANKNTLTGIIDVAMVGSIYGKGNLYENLQKDADHVFLFYGDNSDKENSSIRQHLKEIPKDIKFDRKYACSQCLSSCIGVAVQQY